MKRYALISGLVLSALALTNCTTKEYDTREDVVVKKGVPFEIIAQPSDETKTTAGADMSTLWDAENDKLNVFHKLHSATNYTSDGDFSVADATTGTFSGTISENVPVAGNNYDWVAVYPYDSQITAFAPSNRYYYVGGYSTKAQLQNGTNSTSHLAGYGYYASGDSEHHRGFPLWGKKEDVTYSASGEGYVSPVISMNQVCSVLAFNITNSTAAAINVSKIEFTATEDIVGAYNIDFSGGTPSFTKYNDYQSETVTLDVINGTIAAGTSGTFYAGIKPFTVDGSSEAKTLSMTVYTEGGESQTKEFTISGKTMTFAPNKYKNVNMSFTTAHNTSDFVQITSLDDILTDAEYMLVLPDGKDPYYYAVQVAGTSGNLADISSRITKEGGLLKYNSPNANLIWTIANVSGGGYNFKNGSYCIWKPSSGTDINTKYAGSCYWTPEALGDNLFSLVSGGKYIAEGQSTTVVKNYDHIINQVAQNQGLPIQYAGAWAILRRGGTVLPSSGIGFSTGSYVFTLGDTDYCSFTGQALTNPHEVNVTWSSSNEELATVSDGIVSFVPNMVGKTTISASFTTDGTYKTETVSYTITVKSGANGYLLVESAPDDWSGKYVIAYVNNNNAILLGAKSSSGNYATYSNSITIANNVIDASAGGPYQVSIDKTTNGYSILFEGSSSYIGYTGTTTSGNNYLFYDTTFASSKYEWTITLGSSALATIKNIYNTSRVLKYNSTSGQERFACYTTGQNLVKLFKLQGDEPELSPLASIAVSGQQTQFIEGVDFSLGNNGVVTATYEDGSNRDVTSLVTVSGYNKNTLGQQTVTLSYTEGDVTKTTSYTVTVVAKTVTELQLSAYTATWTVGNTWAWDGTAKAKYDNGSTTTLTSSDLSFSYKNASNVSVTAEAMMSTAGNYTITASYTENGTTVTADIEITVNNAVINGYDELFTFNSAAWGSTNSNGYSNAFSSGKNGALNSGYVQVTTTTTGANATSNYVFGDLQTVKVVYHTNTSSGVGAISVKVGSTTKTFNVTKPSSGGTTDKTATLDFSAENPTGTATLTVTCTTNSIYIKSIEFIGDGDISAVEGGDGVTVSMSSFSSTSGNVGGDENISYLAEKGTAGTAPAVNSNQIRIYQNGGLLTVSANNGKKITSVTIGSAMGTTVQVSLDGGAYSSNNSISAGGIYTKDSIEVSSITFKCTGTSSSTRLYLNYLSVTYE